MKKLDYAIRAVQVDLARQMETVEFLKGFIDFIADNHFNTLFLYLEWRVRTKTYDIGKDEGYSAAELRGLVRYAQKRGVEIIPGLACLGHAELILEQEKYARFAELRDGATGRFWSPRRKDFCPSLPEVRRFLSDYFTEVAAIFPSKYIHVGGDEVWDMGFCPICKEKAKDFAGEEKLYLDHFLFMHDLVTRKLGREMMMWDDMFEYYPEVLPQLPKDIIMTFWQYQENAHCDQGHFANLAFSDRLAEYDRLGFRYLVAPADFNRANIESLTDYARAHKPLGGLLTSWVKRTSLLYKLYPQFAAAGALWSGAAREPEEAMQQAAQYLFGRDDALLTEALRLYCTTLRRAAQISLGNLMTAPYFGHDQFRPQGYRMLMAAFAPYFKAVETPQGQLVLQDIYDHCVAKDLAARSMQDAWKQLNGQPCDDWEALLAELDGLAERSIKQCKVTRRPCDTVHFERNFAAWRKAIADFRSGVKKQGLLRVLFNLPDGYGAEKIRIRVRANGAWHEVADGVLKLGENVADPMFYRWFFIPADLAVEAVEFTAKGFGEQGVCHVAATTRKGTFVPAAVSAAVGAVEHPTHLLTADSLCTWLGDTDVLAAFHQRERAEVRHSITVEMKQE